MAKTLLLDKKTSVVLKPVAPYAFDATVFKPSHYPDPLKVYEPGKYWFALRLPNAKEVYGVRMESRGSTRKPRIRITIFSRSSLAAMEKKRVLDELAFRFEFDRDIRGLYQRCGNDAILSPILKKWYGMHGSSAQNLYELLMIGIFLQNTVVKRSVQMTEALLDAYGMKLTFDGKTLYTFWTPEGMADVPEEALRKWKVGYRAKLFVKTSQTFIREGVDEIALRTLPTEEAKRCLCKLYGVGPETVRILLTEALHRYEIFEHVAPWQQKILSRLLFRRKLVPAERIIRYAKSRWGEWVGLALHSVWEDVFWRRKQGEKIPWLEKEIRL